MIYDLDAEAAAIGGCLLNREAREYAFGGALSIRSFYDLKHRMVWTAMALLHGQGDPIDITTLAAEMHREKTLERVGGKGWLNVLFAQGSSLGVRAHIDLVADRSSRRELMTLGETIRSKAADLQQDPTEIVGTLEREAEKVKLPMESIIPPMELDEFLAIEDPPDDWVIRRCLARGDRVIWTSAEGAGKSELQMQLAICAASGIHPFYGGSARRVRVLVVDLENPDKPLRARLRRLRKIAGADYRGGLAIEPRRQGLNLRDPRDFRWLDEKCEQHQPELLVIGPLYKMFRARGNESKADETAAEEAAYAIDKLIVRHGMAVSIEAHSPHGDKGDRADYRPIGASLWLRWPEFGLAMRPMPGEGPMTVDLRHWRGARDRDRDWPRQLMQGHPTTWPWIASDDRRAVA
jgi:hypothetical protein